VPTNRSFSKYVTLTDGSTVNTSESSQSSQGCFLTYYYYYCYYYYYHFTALWILSGLPGWAGTRKVKPGRWNQSGFTGARDSEWQLHQLGDMQICTSPQTDSHASIPPLSFLQAWYPSCHPTNSIKTLLTYTVHIAVKQLLKSFYPVTISASLSINIASISGNGIDLSPLPSVGRLVCPESALWQNGW